MRYKMAWFAFCIAAGFALNVILWRFAGIDSAVLIVPDIALGLIIGWTTPTALGRSHDDRAAR